MSPRFPGLGRRPASAALSAGGVAALSTLLAVTLLTGACGVAERPVSGADVSLPATQVEDLRGGRLSLASVADPRRPVLLWIWGPG
jgi:hypothetical protein